MVVMAEATCHDAFVAAYQFALACPIEEGTGAHRFRSSVRANVYIDDVPMLATDSEESSPAAGANAENAMEV